MHVHDKIFVYGTLKRGHKAHHLLEHRAEFIDNDRVEGTLYNLGAFPGFKAEGTGMVEGEVYEITDDTLPPILDEYEGYPRLYDRIKMRTERGYFPWVYVLKHPVSNDNLLAEGVW